MKTKKKLFVQIKGKQYFIADEIVEKYVLKKGDTTPFTRLEIKQAK
ncbi:MAG: hypothetical protein QGG48_00815 [Desulfatiglandales bacterium]|jgi:hypothetical protein|nr:hypothetical protein [Desulfatiglandales bacterium]